LKTFQIDLCPKAISVETIWHINIVCNYRNKEGKIKILGTQSGPIKKNERMKICQFELGEIEDGTVDDCTTFVFEVQVYHKFKEIQEKFGVGNVNEALFQIKLFSDLQIVCSKGAVHAHRAICAINSEVFEAMLESSKHERSCSLFIIDCDSDIMNEILRFMYTSEAYISLDNARDLLRFNEKYKICNFKDYCFERIVRIFGDDFELILDIMTLAHDFKEETVLRNCMNLVKM
jgi:hypothetical protein